MASHRAFITGTRRAAKINSSNCVREVKLALSAQLDRASSQEAAARELQKETAFTRVKVERVGYSYTFPIRNKHRYALSAAEITEHVFIAFVEDDEDPQISQREHTE